MRIGKAEKVACEASKGFNLERFVNTHTATAFHHNETSIRRHGANESRSSKGSGRPGVSREHENARRTKTQSKQKEEARGEESGQSCPTAERISGACFNQ